MEKYNFKIGDKVKVTGDYSARVSAEFDGWSGAWDLVGLTGVVVGHHIMTPDEFESLSTNYDDEYASAFEDSVAVKFEGHDDLEILCNGPEALVPARDLTKV